MQLYALGVPHTVVVDDLLPVSPYGGLLLADKGDDGSLWSAILEKAFAKYWGNYRHTVGGMPNMAIRTLLGSPSKVYRMPGDDKATVWKAMSEAASAGDIITCTTPGAGDHDVKHPNGLAHSHAYTVIGVVTLSNGVDLVKIRNPWGSEGYTGPWSDESDLWTDELAAEVNLENNMEDGFFFCDIDTFMSSFDFAIVNYETEGKHRGSFLMLDDDLSTAADAGFCKGKCANHTIKITSEVDQTILVSMHTWDKRS